MFNSGFRVFVCWELKRLGTEDVQSSGNSRSVGVFWGSGVQGSFFGDICDQTLTLHLKLREA